MNGDLFPIPSLHSALPVIDDSDFWEHYEIVEVRHELRFPKDAQKSRQEQEMTKGAGHVAAISYEESQLKAENQFFTQRHLASLGVKSRPVAACPFQKSFPMYLIRGSILKHQTRILKHEDMLAKGLLVEAKEFAYINLRVETTAHPYVQDPDDVRSQSFGVFLPILSNGKILKPWKRIIFVSHRWLNPLGSLTSYPHPDDDENSKLRCLKAIIRDDDYVLLDYMSFPQNDLNGQSRAIDSLCWYVYHSSHYRAMSPDAESFEEFLGRGWCQVELLSAFCPVLARSVEVSNGNFYLDYERAQINQYFTCAAQDRALVLANGSELPLQMTMIRNPKHLQFTVSEDAVKVQGVLDTVTAAFEHAIPRREHLLNQQGQLTANRTVTYDFKFAEASKPEIEAMLHLLAT